MQASKAKKYIKGATKPFVSKEDELLMDDMLESGEAEGPEDEGYTEQELRDEGLTWDAPAAAAAKKTKSRVVRDQKSTTEREQAKKGNKNGR